MVNVADGVGSCFTFDDVSNPQLSLQQGINKSRVDEFLRAIAQTRSLVDESIELGGNEMNADYSHRTDSILNWCLNMKERLKCLCALTYGVHFERVDACVERLEACERALRKHQSGRYMREKQLLMMSTSMEDYSVKIKTRLFWFVCLKNFTNFTIHCCL